MDDHKRNIRNAMERARDAVTNPRKRGRSTDRMASDEEYESQQLLCKHLIESAKAHPELWKIKTVHDGQKHYIKEVNEDVLWVVDEFKGQHTLSFLMKESIEAIKELTSDQVRT